MPHNWEHAAIEEDAEVLASNIRSDSEYKRVSTLYLTPMYCVALLCWGALNSQCREPSVVCTVQKSPISDMELLM